MGLLGSLIGYESNRKALNLKKKGIKYQRDSQRRTRKFNKAMMDRSIASNLRGLIKGQRSSISTSVNVSAANGLRGRSALAVMNDSITKTESAFLNLMESANYKEMAMDMEANNQEMASYYGLKGVALEREAQDMALLGSIMDTAASVAMGMATGGMGGMMGAAGGAGAGGAGAAGGIAWGDQANSMWGSVMMNNDGRG